MATSIPTIISNIPNLLHISEGMSYLDSKLEDRSRTGLILASASAVIALSILKSCYQKGWGKTIREKCGDLALRIAYVNKKYAKDIQKEFVHFQESVRNKWGQFQPLSTAIPDKGWDENQLLQLIESYSKTTSEKLKGKQLSGTIYSKSLDNGYEDAFKTIEKKKSCQSRFNGRCAIFRLSIQKAQDSLYQGL